MSFKTLCDLAACADNVSVSVLKINDNLFQVVIQPSIKLAAKYPQLGSPLMIQAPPDALDSEVEKAMASFKPMLECAMSNLDQIQKDLDEAQKAAREKAKKPTVQVKPSSTSGTATNGVKPTAPMQKLESPPDLFGPTESPLTASNGESEEVLTTGDDEYDLPSLED